MMAASSAAARDFESVHELFEGMSEKERALLCRIEQVQAQLQTETATAGVATTDVAATVADRRPTETLMAATGFSSDTADNSCADEAAQAVRVRASGC